MRSSIFTCLLLFVFRGAAALVKVSYLEAYWLGGNVEVHVEVLRQKQVELVPLLLEAWPSMEASLEALIQVEEREKTYQEVVNLHSKHVVIIMSQKAKQS